MQPSPLVSIFGKGQTHLPVKVSVSHFERNQSSVTLIVEFWEYKDGRVAGASGSSDVTEITDAAMLCILVLYEADPDA